MLISFFFQEFLRAMGNRTTQLPQIGSSNLLNISHCYRKMNVSFFLSMNMWPECGIICEDFQSELRNRHQLYTFLSAHRLAQEQADAVTGRTSQVT